MLRPEKKMSSEFRQHLKVKTDVSKSQMDDISSNFAFHRQHDTAPGGGGTKSIAESIYSSRKNPK
jgi:hypothetical protein